MKDFETTVYEKLLPTIVRIVLNRPETINAQDTRAYKRCRCPLRCIRLRTRTG